MKTEELGLILTHMPKDEAEQLWDVLTALRGPDNEDGDVKLATTEVIRWHFLGKAPDMTSFSGSFIAPDSIGSMHMRVYLEANKWYATPSNGHFLGHAMRAFKALGLKWDEVNA